MNNSKKFRRIQKTLIILLVLIVLIVFPSFIIPFLPEKISTFYYRELIYKTIAESLRGNSRSKTLENSFKYVSENLHTFKRSKVVDVNSYIDLVRGIGWCDQQAFLLMHLLNKLGLHETRLRDVQAHTYSEVRFGNKWIIVDPFSSLLFFDKNQQYLSLEDLKLDKEISDRMGVIRSANYYSMPRNFGANYQSIYIKNNVRWNDGIGPIYQDYRSYNLIRNLLELYANYSYSVFGDYYFNWVQEKYLSSKFVTKMNDQGELWIRDYKNSNDEAFRIYFKARNYDVVDRKEKAQILYSQAIESFNHSFWGYKSKYFLGVLEFNNQNYTVAESLFKDLLSNSDEFKSKFDYLTDRNDLEDLIEYYLGKIYLIEGDFGKAASYFRSSDYKHSAIELYKIVNNET